MQYEKEKGCISSIPKLNYVFYRTDNLVNGKYYYGVHATDELKDGYLGSGKILKEAIRKYGRTNFRRHDLKFFKSMLEAYDYEAFVVTRDLVADNQCYNVKPGGLGGMKGMVTVHREGKYWKVRIEDLDKILSSDSGVSLGSRLQGRPSRLKGRKQSTEHIQKRSESLKGRVGKKGVKKPSGFGEKIRKARLGKEGSTKDRVSIWKDRVRMLVLKSEVGRYEKEGWIRTVQYRCVFDQVTGTFYVVTRKAIRKYLSNGFMRVKFADLKDERVIFKVIV